MVDLNDHTANIEKYPDKKKSAINILNVFINVVHARSLKATAPLIIGWFKISGDLAEISLFRGFAPSQSGKR